MAKNTPSCISLTPAEQAELLPYASGGSGWHVISKASLPGVVRPAMREKSDSALMIVSGTSSGATILVCNVLRVESQDGVIDQEPFAVAVRGSEAPVSGVFVHHGSWVSRSFDPGDASGNTCQAAESGITS